MHVTKDAGGVRGAVLTHVDISARLITDESYLYRTIGKRFEGGHESVMHSVREYARGDVHTNTIEGFWSLFKRTLKGTYIHIEPCHIDRYLHEQTLRYNLRKGNDLSRFVTVLSQISGRRLTWKELTA